MRKKAKGGVSLLHHSAGLSREHPDLILPKSPSYILGGPVKKQRGKKWGGERILNLMLPKRKTPPKVGPTRGKGKGGVPSSGE